MSIAVQHLVQPARVAQAGFAQATVLRLEVRGVACQRPPCGVANTAVYNILYNTKCNVLVYITK